ncbi:MAG: ECF-type sigma factor [Pseudomonadales bacterium]
MWRKFSIGTAVGISLPLLPKPCGGFSSKSPPHCFAGLTIEQTATTLRISEDTRNRKWAFARDCLYHEIYGDPEEKF